MAETSREQTWIDIDYVTDSGLGQRARIGMVVISNDQTLSAEARAMLSLPGIALYEARLPTTRKKNEPVSEKNLSDQSDAITTAIRQINSLVPSDVVALGCTSAAMVIGPESLRAQVQSEMPNAAITDPFSALKAALSALRARKVGYLSPYPRDLAARMVDSIEGWGIAVPVVASFTSPRGNIGDDAGFITPQSIDVAIRRLILEADVDTVVVACTQMRIAKSIEALEKTLGVRIISSNHALCWHALRLSGNEETVPEWGSLFTLGI